VSFTLTPLSVWRPLNRSVGISQSRRRTVRKDRKFLSFPGIGLRFCSRRSPIRRGNGHFSSNIVAQGCAGSAFDVNISFSCPLVAKVRSLRRNYSIVSRLRLKCDGTRAETRFRISAKRTCPFKSAGESVQFTTGSRSVRISGSNAGYTTFRGSVKNTGYPHHSPVSPSLPLPCVNVCHYILAGL
jgi:hypothetical protein